MGIMGSMFNNAGKANVEKIEKELEDFLLPDESVDIAFKLVRDKFVFTNKRLIITDKQGITGKKMEYMSIPYRAIVRYSIETNGHFDLDSELNIWLASTADPITSTFTKREHVKEIQLVLSNYVLA